MKTSKGYSEIKVNKDINHNVIDTSYVLTFSLLDTSFIYVYDSEKYHLSRFIGFENFKYENSRNDNNIYLKKVSIYDEFFTEEYFYNSEYEFSTIKFKFNKDSCIFISSKS